MMAPRLYTRAAQTLQISLMMRMWPSITSLPRILLQETLASSSESRILRLAQMPTMVCLQSFLKLSAQCSTHDGVVLCMQIPQPPGPSSSWAVEHGCQLSFCHSNPGLLWSSDVQTGYYAYINRNGYVGLSGTKNGVYQSGMGKAPCFPTGTQAFTSPGSFALNHYYHIRLTAVNATFKYYLDDMTKPLITCTDPYLIATSGQIGIRNYGTLASWANESVTSPQQ